MTGNRSLPVVGLTGNPPPGGCLVSVVVFAPNRNQGATGMSWLNQCAVLKV